MQRGPGEHFTIIDRGKRTAELGPVGGKRGARSRRAALETILDIQKRVNGRVPDASMATERVPRSVSTFCLYIIDTSMKTSDDVDT